MTKKDSEKALRHLFHVWRDQSGNSTTPESELCFSDFLSWTRKNYSEYLQFRSVMPVEDVVESWFDQVFHQTWRN